MDAALFVIKLKDMMSGGMHKIASTAQSSFSRVDRAVERTNRLIKSTRPSVDMLNRKLDELRKTCDLSINTSQIRAANREMQRLERQIDRTENLGRRRSGGGGLLGAVGGMRGLAMTGLFAAGTALVAGGGAAISSSAKREQQLVGMKTFLGAGAQGAFDNIKKDAAATPYSLDALVDVNRALISAGLSAKEARKDTMNLANAVAATGGGNDELSRMAANMQQIKTLGTATAVDIKQFGMAGINIYKLLSDATGKTVDQVKDMEVSYDLLSYALDKAAKSGGAYAGALQAQSLTVTGKWSTFKDNMVDKAAQIGDALAPLTHKFLDMANGFLTTMPSMVSAIQPFIDTLSTLPLGDLVGGIQELVAAAAGLLIPIFQALRPTISLLVSSLGSLFKTLRETVAHILTAASPALLELANILGVILPPAIKVLGWLLEKLIIWVGRAIEGLVDMAGYIIKPFEYVLNVLNAVLGTSNAISKNASFIGGSAANVGKQINATYAVTATKGVVAKPRGLASIPSGGASSSSGSGTGLRGDSITGGGRRPINITVNKFFEDFNISTQSVNEGYGDLERKLQEMLLRVLQSANAVE